MSTSIQTIMASAKTLIAARITANGDTPQELKYRDNIEQNDDRNLAHGYSIIPRTASPAEAKLVRQISLEQIFETVLTDTYVRSQDDAQKENVVESLMGIGEEIAKQYINTRISNPSIVQKVSEPSILDIEFNEASAKKFVAYRMQVTVTYRIDLDT